MLKRYHRIFGGIFRCVDALVIGAAWLGAYWLRFNLPLIEVTKGFPDLRTYAALTPLVMILWTGVLSAMRVYPNHRMLRRTHEAQLLLRAHGAAMLFFIALTYLFSEYKYSRGVMLYFGILGGFGLVFFRLLLRNGLRSLRRKGYNLRYILAVGEGPALETLIRRLERFPELGLRVKGVVTQEASPTREIGGKPVLGHFREIQRLIHEYRPDQLVISLPRQQYPEMDRILAEIRDETLAIRIIPDIHEYVTLGCEIEDFDGMPIVNINDSPLAGWGAAAKRVTDILVSAVALVVLAPLMALVALAVRLTSPGPVFYSQERMGLDGRVFRMYKFRSMRVDADPTATGWTRPNDDRRTPIGRFIRATSLDELPQFWNVLLGHMSLVGPRPERPVFVSKFRTEIPGYMLRHKVKAGITGWAQVNGWRGDTSLESRIECDLYYIRNWSYFLDWKILGLTLWKGVLNKNAY